jgi:sulfhydrogenase subunit beta (sulfur reductase)
MAERIPSPGEQVVIAKPALQHIFDALQSGGYSLIAPTLSGEAIIYDQVTSIEEMPLGWTAEYSPGNYRLQNRGDEQFFSFPAGPSSWKGYLYPSKLSLFTTSKNAQGYQTIPSDETPQRYAFIGARACELAAIAIQDRVFMEGAYSDPHYKTRRENAFVLAANCTDPGNNCFCTSMGTGPRCTQAFDLALTELKDAFVIEVGSSLGAHMLANVEWQLAGALELSRANQKLIDAENKITRSFDTRDLPELLLENLDHPRWDEVAQRCLSCANCTLVCPTCFCSDVKDISDLSAENTERVRVWDSCFNPDFSYVHGGHLRPNIRARYRQWLTHKLASWIEQFGTSGCVGCGRCITWCPVGIDLTEEVAAIRGEA